MKTAMQELIDEIKLIESYPMNPLVLRIATDLLEKEKEQIIEARIDGITCAAAFQETPSKYTTGEQYYNQTYKQISDIVVDAIKSQVTTTDVWTPKTN